MSKKVIVAGHICLDITPVFPAIDGKNLSEILSPGHLVEMKGVDVHTGGAVANTGLAMKLLGTDVSLKGKVGADAFGEIVLNTLKKYEAADGMIIADEESTSYSVVLAVPGIDRIFLHNPGANNTFCAADISKAELENASLFHFGYPPLMASMYAKGGEELVALMKRAKEAGTATSLDLAAVDEASAAGSIDWRQILKNVLPYVDFFVPSVEELCFMLDRERFARWKERAACGDVTEFLNIEKDVKPLADQCMQWGAKVLLIKCGAPGIYYQTANQETLTELETCLGWNMEDWADQEGFEKSYVPEKILSGTGAGDTSIAAFLAAMLEGNSLRECMQLATATGASCVASYDALGGLKSLPDLRKKIAEGWQKMNHKKAGNC